MMLPAGYLLKHVSPPSGWLEGKPGRIKEVCSVADCVNDNAVNVQAAFRHNSFGVANDPEALASLAAETGLDVSGASLFYYTAYQRELESDGWSFDPAGWRARSPVRSAGVGDDVRSPDRDSAVLLGYDVVVFGDFLEHSPLSCNAVAERLTVNEHCLLDSLEAAVTAIDAGAFGGGCEQGVYTIFSVNLVR